MEFVKERCAERVRDKNQVYFVCKMCNEKSRNLNVMTNYCLMTGGKVLS